MARKRKLYYKQYYKKNKKEIAQKRKNNLKTNKCLDCGNPCWYTSKRCKSCSVIKRNKSIKYRKHMSKITKGRKITWDIFKGKQHTEISKEKMSKAHKGKKLSDKTKQRIKITLKKLYKEGKIIAPGYKIHIHHVDLNKSNNNSNNHLKLSASLHRKIHARAYNYLVKIGKIKEYMIDFKTEFKKDFEELNKFLDQ
jgi:hypothetical protein